MFLKGYCDENITLPLFEAFWGGLFSMSKWYCLILVVSFLFAKLNVDVLYSTGLRILQVISCFVKDPCVQAKKSSTLCSINGFCFQLWEEGKNRTATVPLIVMASLAVWG